MDSRQHSTITGGTVTIDPSVGGSFSTFGGYATGVNVELEPGRRIVQTWRASDWPKGADSRVTFTLAKAGKGTRLTFSQIGVPPAFRRAIADGWRAYYWEPLAAYFANRR